MNTYTPILRLERNEYLEHLCEMPEKTIDIITTYPMNSSVVKDNGITVHGTWALITDGTSLRLEGMDELMSEIHLGILVMKGTPDHRKKELRDLYNKHHKS